MTSFPVTKIFPRGTSLASGCAKGEPGSCFRLGSVQWGPFPVASFALTLLLHLFGFLACENQLAADDRPAVAGESTVNDSSTGVGSPQKTARETATSPEASTPKTTPPVEQPVWKKLRDHWKACEFGGDGEVQFKPSAQSVDSIHMHFGDPLTGVVWAGDVPREDYELRLQARRTDGFDFLCGLTFPVDQTALTFIMGGWGGGVTGISSINERDASENETTTYVEYKDDHWYKVRVRVSPFGVECWIDGKQVVELPRLKRKFGLRFEMEVCEPLGIACFESKTDYRGVEWRKLTKKEITAATKKAKQWVKNK